MEVTDCVCCKYKGNCEFAAARISENRNTDPCDDFCDHYHALIRIAQDPRTSEYFVEVDGRENENAYRSETSEQAVDIIYGIWGNGWNLEEHGSGYSIRISEQKNGYIRVNGIPYIWDDNCIPWKSENGEIILPRWMGFDTESINWDVPDDWGVFVPIYDLVRSDDEYYPHVSQEECGYLLFAASEDGMIADQPDYNRPSRIIIDDQVSEIESFDPNGW